ncbi:putative transporter [Lachnellula suecica]|uniref:Putative transporter n=1 Tax=Lachnellula suecica TaxID=602035 RepID=A0A8T9CG88_9HELO|nr:putative transporter [Lachnellula suecica]
MAAVKPVNGAHHNSSFETPSHPDAAENMKESSEHIEKIQEGHAGLDDSNVLSKSLPTINSTYYDAETKRILRKIDYRLLPMLTLLYVLSFLDRGNIGNAKVAGMNADLKLTGTQYNLALTVFFFPYAVFEIPSNIVLKLMRPSIWICILMISWGTIMTLQGIVQNYHGLLITRILLGFSESGFFPAATYLLTIWYCRFEVQTRLAVFYSAASLAGAFSGLLAFAIDKMDGIGGLSGWRWIYILEGILTVAIACTLPWTLPDSPQRANFLTTGEKGYINRRLEQDAGTSAGTVRTLDTFKWKYLVAALTEWKLYFGMIAYWGNSAPTIINQLGYTAANAQLLNEQSDSITAIPIYTLGVISTLVFSHIADRYQTRWPFIVAPFCIAMVGLIGLISIPHPRLPGLTYAFLFTIPAGVYPPLIGILSWFGNNLAPSWKRAVGMALLISLGNLGGAVGSNIFIERQAPDYWLGYGFCLGIVSAAITCTVILRVAYGRVNKERDLMNEEEVRAMYTEEELLDMGDKSPLYRSA